MNKVTLPETDIVENSWTLYRIGDMFFDSSARDQENGRRLHMQLYNESIASEYMKRTSKSEVYTLMADIVSKRQKSLKDKIPDLIVHIRAGDVLEDEIRLISRNPNYNSCELFGIYMMSVEDLVDRIKPSCTQKEIHVCVVTGGNHTVAAPKSLQLLRIISHEIAKHPKVIAVTTRFFESPDDDFVLMCSTANLISSGGGFGMLAENTRSFGTSIHRRNNRR